VARRHCRTRHTTKVPSRSSRAQQDGEEEEGAHQPSKGERRVAATAASYRNRAQGQQAPCHAMTPAIAASWPDSSLCGVAGIAQLVQWAQLVHGGALRLHTSAVALAVEDEPSDELLPDTTDPWGQARKQEFRQGPARRSQGQAAHQEGRAAGAANASAIGQGQCHDGTVFQRGPDHIPRGNVTLYFKCLYRLASRPGAVLGARRLSGLWTPRWPKSVRWRPGDSACNTTSGRQILRGQSRASGGLRDAADRPTCFCVIRPAAQSRVVDKTNT